MSETFSGAVKKAMQEKRYNARQLALAIDVDPSYLTRLLKGERTSPSKEIVLKIAGLLQLNPDELLWLAGIVPPRLRSMPNTEEVLQAIEALASMKQEKRRKFLSDLSGK
ncbi:MAG: helix-turn-helix domain-containing protein [Chloroflexi bacterium]|nr:MAG: helix-turn-helix domain-containing protein [Chloroflexota bacterium]